MSKSETKSLKFKSLRGKIHVSDRHSSIITKNKTIDTPKMVNILFNVSAFVCFVSNVLVFLKLLNGNHKFYACMFVKKTFTAFQVLLNSKLHVDVLGRVWDLSDIDKDGMLDKDEFAVVSKFLANLYSVGSIISI